MSNPTIINIIRKCIKGRQNKTWFENYYCHQLKEQYFNPPNKIPKCIQTDKSRIAETGLNREMYSYGMKIITRNYIKYKMSALFSSGQMEFYTASLHFAFFPSQDMAALFLTNLLLTSSINLKHWWLVYIEGAWPPCFRMGRDVGLTPIRKG